MAKAEALKERGGTVGSTRCTGMASRMVAESEAAEPAVEVAVEVADLSA
jgi:hypothetical protein